MPLTAVHVDHGLLDATFDDLGAGLNWATVHRVRPRPDLTCPACQSSVHGKVSKLGLRFFAHDGAHPTCPTRGETVEHHSLKHVMASAVRAAGWRADVEAPGTGWRADVEANRPDGHRRAAWEVQLSPITVDQLRDRTAAYAKASITVCWVTNRPTHWFGHAPAIQVEPGKYGRWQVIEGHRRLIPTRTLSDVHAVRSDDMIVDDDNLCGAVTRDWYRHVEHDLPAPWLTWPQLHSNDPRHLNPHHTDEYAWDEPVPRTAAYRCLIGWARGRRADLNRFVAAVLAGTGVPIELTRPHRDLRDHRRYSQVVWTATNDLPRARKLLAFALGWPSHHGTPCCEQCGCGTSDCLVFDARWTSDVHLCRRCDTPLVHVMDQVTGWENWNITPDDPGPHRLGWTSDPPELVYQPPPRFGHAGG